MLIVKSRNLTELGVLENAYNVSVELRRNELWTAKFSLPMDDPKRKLCSHLNFVAIYGPETGRYYGLYRIMPTNTTKSIETNRVTYELEHVLSTLLDDVIDGVLPALINQPTDVQLQRLLDLQTTKHWRLGTVEFSRLFQYSFENENGLLAPILSIPKPFDEEYEFTFDTESYPWTLNLVKSSNDIRSEVRWGKDMISFDEVSDPTEIVNYIIPKGYGEGVNQLTIEDVNGGEKFLKDDASIAVWGLRKYIWIDRRFKHADSLKESAQSLLRQWRDPKISFDIEAVDLTVLPDFSNEPQRLLNTKTQIIVEDSDIERVYNGRILEVKIPDLDKEYEAQYSISNRLDDAATIQADVERKQRVNEAYSQGATNILSYNYQDNCDDSIPALIPFYIDDDVVNINTVELTFRTKRFRAYSRATKGGGATVKSTSSGGGTTRSTSSGGGTSRSTSSGGGSSQTSSSGGGTSTSTQSGGGSSQTSAAGGDHDHTIFVDNGSSEDRPGSYRSMQYNDGMTGGTVRFVKFGTGNIKTYTSSGNHSHSVNIPAHSHNFTVPAHTHSVNIPNHTHDVTIPSHTHEVTIPNHTHDIELPNHTHDVQHEIVELTSTPSSVTIKVDGNVVPHTSTSGNRINLVDYMAKDSSGKITRGRHEVEILPNGLARIEADLICRVFIQSQLGGTF